MSDRTVLYASAFLRSLATGMMGVLLGIHLAKIGFDEGAIGLVIGAGLAGAAGAALLATFGSDRAGRRRSLILLALLGAAGIVVFTFTTTVVACAVAAFVGMLNGMGRDRGAALILEQAVLPSTVDDTGRTGAFAWYNVLQDAGHALGSLAAGLPALMRAAGGLGELASFRTAFVVNAALVLVPAVLYLRLSPGVETPARAVRARVSPHTRRVLVRISSLFALDSLGGGFLTTALVALFFYKRFHVSEAVVAILIVCARLLNALSHLGAAWLARRIGLVNTMVFTHMPSSLLLITVGFVPSFPVAAALFLLREGLVEMDVPTRQSYVMAVVAPAERTLASGVTHLVRLGGWAVAPLIAGHFMKGALGVPLIIGACLKLVYDVLLYVAFKEVKAPEERREADVRGC
jgi:MFS family permease